MAQANDLIKQFADNQTIYYLDLAAKMPPVAIAGWVWGRTSCIPDVGYQIWADTMEPLLSKLLAEK